MSSSCPANAGTATVTIKNTSSQSINGTLHFLIKERHIDYPWGNMKEVECCNRGMIPDHKGESVTLAAGAEVTKERSFTIKNEWNKDNCRLVAFLQKSDKEIVEACRIKVDESTSINSIKTLKREKIIITFRQGSLKISSLYNGKYTVTLVNLQGRTMKTYVLDNPGEWINIPDVICSGIHFIKIKTKNLTVVKMLKTIQ